MDFVETASEPVQKATIRTFYCWNEKEPSSQTINISGGERIRDGNGRIYGTAHREVRFNKGLLKLDPDDTQAISVLEKMAKDPATGVTEDYELYLTKTLEPERNASRAHALLAKKDQEIDDLKAQLRKKAATK